MKRPFMVGRVAHGIPRSFATRPPGRHYYVEHGQWNSAALLRTRVLCLPEGRAAQPFVRRWWSDCTQEIDDPLQVADMGMTRQLTTHCDATIRSGLESQRTALDTQPGTGSPGVGLFPTWWLEPRRPPCNPLPGQGPRAAYWMAEMSRDAVVELRVCHCRDP